MDKDDNTNARIESIRARANDATPGPWCYDVSMTDELSIHLSIGTRDKQPEHPHSPRFIAWMTGMVADYVRPTERPDHYICPGCHTLVYRHRRIQADVDIRVDPRVHADAYFIAEARTDVVYLLGLVDQLRDANEEKQRVIDELQQRLHWRGK